MLFRFSGGSPASPSSGGSPELAGFDVPTVPVRVIAVNKLLALNRLAGERDFDRLRGRARDVYDLYKAATHTASADDIRAHIGTLPSRLAAGGVRTQTEESRPQGGFQRSAALTAGTEANEALRESYTKNLPQLLFSDADLPDFDTAMAAIRSLDPQ